MDHPISRTMSKVPAVTLGCWIIKIAATTLGETGGDAVTMTLNLGYLIGTAIFAAILVLAVSAQLGAKRFHPFLYWAVVVATTTVGTTLADFVARSLGVGYLVLVRMRRHRRMLECQFLSCTVMPRTAQSSRQRGTSQFGST